MLSLKLPFMITGDRVNLNIFSSFVYRNSWNQQHLVKSRKFLSNFSANYKFLSFIMWAHFFSITKRLTRLLVYMYIFIYICIIYIYIYIIIHFTKQKLITRSIPALNLPEKCIIPSFRNICYISYTIIYHLLWTLNCR